MLRYARLGNTLHLFSFPVTKKEAAFTTLVSLVVASGWQVIIFLLPWKYELSPWGMGSVAPRTEPYLMSSGTALVKLLEL